MISGIWCVYTHEWCSVYVSASYVHVLVLTCLCMGSKWKKEGWREWEWGGWRKRKFSNPCPSDCVVKGSSPALWDCTLIPRDQGKEITRLFIPFSPPPSDVVKHTTDPDSDSSRRSTLVIISSFWSTSIPAVLSSSQWLMWAVVAPPRSITHPLYRCLFSPVSSLSSSSIPPHHCAAFLLSLLSSLQQEHFCSVYSPKHRLPNKVKPRLSAPGSTLSHPIWKSYFFPRGPGELFTGDGADGQAHGFYAYRAKCVWFPHIWEHSTRLVSQLITCVALKHKSTER